MSIKLKHLAVATLAASISGIAVAGDYKSEHGESMSKATPDFSRIDNDNDGTISRADVRNTDAAHAEKLTEKRSELDTNSDGELDRAEFARFEIMDENVDAYDKHDYGTDERKDQYDTGMQSPR